MYTVSREIVFSNLQTETGHIIDPDNVFRGLADNLGIPERNRYSVVLVRKQIVRGIIEHGLHGNSTRVGNRLLVDAKNSAGATEQDEDQITVAVKTVVSRNGRASMVGLLTNQHFTERMNAQANALLEPFRLKLPDPAEPLMITLASDSRPGHEERIAEYEDWIINSGMAQVPFTVGNLSVRSPHRAKALA